MCSENNIVEDNGGCGCSSNTSHDHDGCCGDHGPSTVKMVLDDGSEIECAILDIFKIEEQEYIALLHPIDETALLYKFFDYDDGTIEVNSIDCDKEFAKVEEYMNSIMEVEE